ncbi:MULTISPECIES: PAS domain-containing protein [unclassified Micromonospora]|uniref:PAS domain-containing protein n=1 Tax=unclassified Micromonospora TaxID=2617518 RepID=UPI002FF162DE
MTQPPRRTTGPDDFRWRDVFAAGGEMGARIAAHDWSATPLGPVDSWPQSLRTAVTICLHSRFPILLWWGPELVMLHNDAYLPILGSSKRDALGRPGATVWPEIWDVIGPMLTGVLAGEGATWSQDQLLLLDRNGFVEECYLTFSYSPIIDESGGVFTAVTETTDRVVSDRRLRAISGLTAALVDAVEPDEVRAEAAARAAQHQADQRFRTLVEASSAVVWTADAAGAIVAPQPSWEAYTGQRWEQYRGTGWGTALHPQDRPRIEAAWQEAVAGRAPLFEAEGRLWHAASGGYRHFAVRAASLRDPAGAITEWIGTVDDIEDRVVAEAAARRTAAISSALLDSAPIGVGLVDTELRHLHVNPALAAFHGRPAEDHLGRRPSELRRAYPPRVEQLMRRALDRGPVVGVESTAEPLPGGADRRHFVSSYFPIRIAGTDELVGLGFTVVDVTGPGCWRRSARNGPASSGSPPPTCSPSSAARRTWSPRPTRRS